MYNRKQIELIRQQLTQVAAMQSLSGVDTSLTTMCLKVIKQYLWVEDNAMICLAENQTLKAENQKLRDALNSNLRTAVDEIRIVYGDPVTKKQGAN